jgi:hypothetical protein
MLIQTINGKAAIPLRALPFVTSGLIDGLTLAEFVVTDQKLWPYPVPSLFSIATSGSIRDVPADYLVRMKNEMLQGRTENLELQRRRIPFGVLIWVEEAQALYSAVARDFVDARICEPDVLFGAWSLDPLLSTQEVEFVLEGLSGGSVQSNTLVSKGKLLPNGVDPSLKTLAIQIAQNLAPKQRHKPTRIQVAAILACNISMDKATVERRIRAKWW